MEITWRQDVLVVDWGGEPEELGEKVSLGCHGYLGWS